MKKFWKILKLNKENMKLLGFSTLAFFILFISYILWKHYHSTVSTDNAYINANIARISSQISGPISNLYVENNQKVQKGDKLFDIDPLPYELDLAKAESELVLIKQEVEHLNAEVTAAKAHVAQREAELKNAASNLKRTQVLVQQKFLSQDMADNIEMQHKSAISALKVAEARYEQAKIHLGEPGEQNERVKNAMIALERAQMNLDYTHIFAPESGIVTNMNLRPGNMVKAHESLFALVNDEKYWVDANFKETEIAPIKPGQIVKVKLDMYPHRVFKGMVESISGGSGTAFSLLPPQNATGNWVKVIQRVPVRILILEESMKAPLRVGTTASVIIYLKNSRAIARENGNKNS